MNGTGGLELFKVTNKSVTDTLHEAIPLTKRSSKNNGGTKCKPECKDAWKEVFLQNVILSHHLIEYIRDNVFLKDGLGFYDDCCHTCYLLEENEIFKGGRNLICPLGDWPNTEQV